MERSPWNRNTSRYGTLLSVKSFPLSQICSGELVAFSVASTPISAASIDISRLYTSVSCVNTLRSMYSMIGNIFCSVFNLFQYCGLVPKVSSDNQHLGRFIFESACLPAK
jgi:hypothetical protein